MKVSARVGKIVERYPVPILIVVLILSALAVWSAVGISVVTTQDAFISTESEAYQGYQAYEQAFGGDAVMILIPGSPVDLATPEALQGFTELLAKLTADPRIRSVVSPLTVLGPAVTQGGVDLTDPGSALQAALQDESLRAQLEQFFRSGHALVSVRLAGGLTTDEQSDAASFIQEAVGASPFASGAIVAGTPRLIADVQSAIFSDLARTGVIAIVLMVLILFLVFPARWRLISLPVVLIGVLWTFGLVAALNIPLTLVTLAGLPILIGLGVDFSIQFHNRYEEEMRRRKNPAEALIDAITHIGPAVGVAVFVMILGFATLLISVIPAVRDFGILLAIGAAVLYALSLFVLNAFLYRFDRQPRTNPGVGSEIVAKNDGGGRERRLSEARGASPNTAWDTIAARGRGLLSRDWLHLGEALPAVSRWSRRHASWVVGSAVLLAALGVVVDSDLTVQTDIEKLIPRSTPGVVALDRARSVVGGGLELPLLVRAPDVTAPAVLEWMAEFQARALEFYPQIGGSNSLTSSLGVLPGNPVPPPETVAAAIEQLPPEIRMGLVAPDKSSASITFNMSETEIEALNVIIDDLLSRANPPAGVTLSPGGTMTLAARAVDATTENRGLIAGIGIVVVFFGLLAVYRSWRRALIAVVPIALVTGWSSALMWVTGVDLNPLTAVLGALVIAIGTEFTVLLLSRYWEERGRGIPHDLAMEEAMAKVGRAITASALTVAAGFGALIFSSFPALRDFGIVIVIDVVLCLIVTVTIVPPLVHWLDRGGIRSVSVK